jgi:DNA polymerase-4
MGIREALARCPQAVVVPGSFDKYLSISERVFEIVEGFSPAVEQISIDEAFVDVCGASRLFGEPESIARRIRSQVRADTGLAISVGVAPTKFLAKVANRCAKPDGLLVVAPGGELEFLHPLPVEAVWGIGPVTASHLHARGIYTVGELASVPVRVLARWLGPGVASHLHALSWNLDPRPVTKGRRASSVGAQSALGPGTTDSDVLSRVLVDLADRVAGRLRSKHRSGRTVTLRVRRPSMAVVTRATTLSAPVSSTAALHHTGMRLLADARVDRAERVTLLGISVSKLSHQEGLQLELPLWPGDPAAAGSRLGADHLQLDLGVDEARRRFGRSAVKRASALLEEGRGVPDGFRRLAEH